MPDDDNFVVYWEESYVKCVNGNLTSCRQQAVDCEERAYRSAELSADGNDRKMGRFIEATASCRSTVRPVF